MICFQSFDDANVMVICKDVTSIDSLVFIYHGLTPSSDILCLTQTGVHSRGFDTKGTSSFHENQ